ncbi:MAG: nickel pincer cofactor biosynthesis protein LarC [Cyanobacteria bacterium REEB67]|nr:nickel pincer cofactor biosynthesis protein LarC [Cyanobacteria bacterium REEB67]
MAEAAAKILKTAYFDCAFGAAGDMLVGACLDCGVDVAFVEAELRKLDLPSASFTTSAGRVHRASIYATKFEVTLAHDEHGQSDGPEHGHGHEHGHSHEHSHEHGHDRGPADGLKPERALSSILLLIDQSTLAPSVKALASAIFRRLGQAEASVHGVSVDDIHFHEVGAIDAICDIVGFAIAYTKLGIEAAYVSPVPLGSGTVQTMHGRYPVPGPAVLALMRDAGAPSGAFALPYECLTPTGAAILCTVATQFGDAPPFERIESVGYGAGTLNPGGHPNVARLILGESRGRNRSKSSYGSALSANTYDAEVVAMIETNVDDLAPSVMAFAMEKLLEAGALDVTLTPIVMKKGRLAQKITVIARAEDRAALTSIVLAETSAIGVRSYFCERLTLSRDFQQVTIGEGPAIKLKIARDSGGRLVNIQPEYEDLATHARESGLPLKEVLLRSLGKAGELIDSQKKT